MASMEAEIRTLLDCRSEATRMKDLDRLMSLYSSDVVYFDVVPPLRYVGASALRGRFAEWFDRWKSAIGQEIRELIVQASGDVAAAHMLVLAGGTRKDGQEVRYWVRVSDCCRRDNHRWLITHEHVSVPVDLASGRAALELVP
jgi:ketosteroid isomerase-like protein